MFKSRVFLPGLAIFCVAALVRGLYLLESSDNPTFLAPIVDSFLYDQMARAWLAGETMLAEFFWQPVFYPLFLSLVYWLSDHSILWVKLIQMVMGSLTCVLALMLGARLFDRTTGLWAGFLLAVYMPLVFFEGELVAAGWAAFWSLVVLLVFLRAADRLGIRHGLLLGGCAAFSVIIRPVFLPFVAVGCLWLLIVWLRKKAETRKIVSCALGVMAGMVIVAGPVAYFSYKETGKVSITPHSGGINLYVGNNPDYKKTVTARPGLQWQAIKELPRKEGITDPYEAQRFFHRKTMDYITGSPLLFLKGLGYKTVQFLSPREMARNVDIYLFHNWSLLLQVGVWKVAGFGFPFGLLLPLAVLGAFLHRRSIPGILWLFVILYPAAVILVFVSARYRVPVVPVLVILGAAGFLSLVKMIGQQRWAHFAGTAFLILAMAGVGSAIGPFYVEEVDYEPELYYTLADSFNRRGRVDEAVAANQKAIELNPDFAEAHYNLSVLYAQLGRFDEAEAACRAALKILPDFAEAYMNEGVIHYRNKRYSQAVQAYRQAVEHKPDLANAQYGLGSALLKLRLDDEALQAFRETLRVEPDHAYARYYLGLIYLQKGDRPSAFKEYDQLLSVNKELAAKLLDALNAR